MPRPPTISLTVGTFIAVLVCGAAIAVLAVTYVESRETIAESAHQLIEQVGTSVEHRVGTHLASVHRAVAMTGELMADGTLDWRASAGLEAYRRASPRGRACGAQAGR